MLFRSYFLLSTDARWLLLSGGFADVINQMTVNQLVENSLWLIMKPVRDQTAWAALREVLCCLTH